jgi:hypothetical protein
MLFTSTTRPFVILAVFGLLSTGFVFGETVTSRQLEMEKEGVKLIGHLERAARDIGRAADRLNVWAGDVHVSRQARYYHLEQIKSLVNEGLRPALKRLTEIQPQLPAWQQDAIDQMLASAKALAADTNSAILNQNYAGALPIVHNVEYKELISSVYENAIALVETSNAAGDYAAAHQQAVEAGLRVPRQ